LRGACDNFTLCEHVRGLTGWIPDPDLVQAVLARSEACAAAREAHNNEVQTRAAAAAAAGARLAAGRQARAAAQAAAAADDAQGRQVRTPCE